MLKCKQVSQMAATDQLEQQGFMMKLQLRMHLMMCRHCRTYVSQIKAIGRGARKLVSGREADPGQLQKMEDHIVECCCGKDHDEG